MKLAEFSLIRRLRAQIPRAYQEPFRLRDDAASLGLKTGESLLLTTDTLVEGIDFHPGTRPELAGQKALAMNLSDIAAMGGCPRFFAIALGVPRRMQPAWLERFYRGMLKWARRYKLVCAGGDISAAKEFFAAVTLIGTVRRGAAVRRSGARPGDWIGVTGSLGGSILGRHLRFQPRMDEGRWLGAHGARAMIDISDGFLQDLEHLLEESHAGACLEKTAIPISSAALRQGAGSATRALRHALSDGEDFELLFAMPPRRARVLQAVWKKCFPRVALSWVGTITGRPLQVDWLEKGRPCAAPRLHQKGFQHFG